MIQVIKKILKNKKNASLQEKIRIERRRIFIEPEIQKWKYKKRRKYQLRIPTWLSRSTWKDLIKFFSLWIIGFTIIFAIIIVYSPILKIQTIEVIRKDDITDINIAYKALQNFRDKFILGVNTKDIAEQLKLYQKNISDVAIQKELPHTLKITIGSYKTSFSTILNQKNYIIVENGVLVPWKAWKEVKELKFTPQYSTINGVLDYKQIFSPKNIETVQYLYERVKYNLLTENIGDIYYFPKEREVHIDIDKTKLIFDINGDIDEQIQRLLIFTKENTKLKNSNILYIDLRVKNKIFFCTLETEFDCRATLKKYYQY